MNHFLNDVFVFRARALVRILLEVFPVVFVHTTSCSTCLTLIRTYYWAS